MIIFYFFLIRQKFTIVSVISIMRLIIISEMLIIVIKVAQHLSFQCYLVIFSVKINN